MKQLEWEEYNNRQESICGSFYIEDNKLFVWIDRTSYSVAESDNEQELKECAEKYIIMMEKAHQETGIDYVDIKPLPQSNKIEYLKDNSFQWSEQIDFDTFLINYKKK